MKLRQLNSSIICLSLQLSPSYLRRGVLFLSEINILVVFWREKPNMRVYPDIFGCLSKYQLAKWAKKYENPTLIFYFYFIFPGSSSKWRKRSLVLKIWSITRISSWRLCHRWVGEFFSPNFAFDSWFISVIRCFGKEFKKLPKTCPPMFCTKRN